jgi:hypothetical protein
MTIIFILSSAPPAGGPPAVIEIGEIAVSIADLGNYIEEQDVGTYITQTDFGNYIDNADVGYYAVQITGSIIIGQIGILRWGLAQFGSTGILGYTPTTTMNATRLSIMKVE